MNQAQQCHQLNDCPGLYIDAFKVFRAKTRDPSCAFVLTHYHSDHYDGLPRDGSYEGPAIVHCTPVTAALLRDVHGVPDEFIAEHPYGTSWNFQVRADESGESGGFKVEGVARITFYDANHCPGAAIVFISLPDGKSHLHTGDMRYHEKMKSYPLIKEAAEQRRLENCYLDTTYSHPKHNFVPQDVAVESIASQVEEVFGAAVKKCKEAGSSDGTSNANASAMHTLVLLSCYSIGKEKVLWEVSQRTNQLVCVSEKKFKMLQCIKGHIGVEESSAIIERCTKDPAKSNVHVVPMGLAGEMWPYFRPNYFACANYAKDLEKDYDRVIAFIPTGWANASNWNKKNAISRRRVEVDKAISGCEGSGDRPGRFIDVEIRLISYSEHSAFAELCSFVEFLRPKKVIPTVFSNERDRAIIEGRFRNLIDSKRARQAFLDSMKGPAVRTGKEARRRTSSNGEPGRNGMAKERVQREKTQLLGFVSIDDDNGDMPERSASKKHKGAGCDDEEAVSTLMSMGFGSAAACRAAFRRSSGSMERAVEVLLASPSGEELLISSATATTTSSSDPSTPQSSTPSSGFNAGQKCGSITQFFVSKKTQR